MKKLQDEKILGGNGEFIESTTNSWLVELPLIVNNVEQMKTLGSRIPFIVYLASIINRFITASDMIKQLFVTKSSAYHSLGKLRILDLIEKEEFKIVANKETKFYHWLERYLELCKMQADIKNDISILFDTVPGYVDGEQAYYLLNYEPGRPIGPANMIIKTYLPFLSFWNDAIKEIRYFKEYPKKVTLEIITKNEKLLWLNGIPYNKNAKDRLGRS